MIPEPSKKETAADFAEVFLGSPAGRRVLKRLQTLFSHSRRRFRDRENGREQSTHPAFVDGQCSVLAEIESTIEYARPGFNCPSYQKQEL